MQHAHRLLEALQKIPGIVILGPQDLTHRGSILSFNLEVSTPSDQTITINGRHFIKPGLLGQAIESNGLIGRAGCSCAGPYGMSLLGITEEDAANIESQLSQDPHFDGKPGWVRIRADFLKTTEDVARAISVITATAKQWLV